MAEVALTEVKNYESVDVQPIEKALIYFGFLKGPVERHWQTEFKSLESGESFPCEGHWAFTKSGWDEFNAAWTAYGDWKCSYNPTPVPFEERHTNQRYLAEVRAQQALLELPDE